MYHNRVRKRKGKKRGIVCAVLLSASIAVVIFLGQREQLFRMEWEEFVCHSCEWVQHFFVPVLAYREQPLPKTVFESVESFLFPAADVQAGLVEYETDVQSSLSYEMILALEARDENYIDENGQVVDGDLILYVCGQYLKKHGDLNNNTVVTTVMSNLGLYKAFDAAGIAYEKTAVGDKYVNENMVKNGHALGGEQSGHIIFSKFATTGDGILTSLKIMEAMIEQKQSLAQLAEPVEIFPQILENVRVYDKAVAQADEDVQKAVKEVEAELGDEGRILVRESGTEPLVRVMVEARSHEICREKVDKVVKVLREKGHVIK